MGGHDSGTSGTGNNSGAPQVYSTRMANNGSGYGSDGYTVVISAQQLNQAASEFDKQLQGQTREDLQRTMSRSVVDPSSFGVIPGNNVAYEAVHNYVTDHLQAMHDMGFSIADFIGRVQAAAQIATETDPATRADAARAAAMLKRMEF